MRDRMRRVRARLLVAGALTASVIAVALPAVQQSGGVTCNLNATTANFDSQLAAATAGQTVCLATGSYGTFGDASGITKSSPGVTIRPQDGATPSLSLQFRSTPTPQWLILDGLTITGGDVSAPANNITIRNSAFTATTGFFTGAGPGDNNACSSCPAMANQALVIEDSTFNGISPGNGHEGRVYTTGDTSTSTPTGLVIRDSEFSGGLSDGFRQDGNRPVTLSGNHFHDILQGPQPTDPHTDCIQTFGTRLVVTGNYFDNCTNGIVQFDGGGNHAITGNVFDQIAVDYPIVLGGDSASTIEHNTLRAGDINLTSKAGQTSTGTVVRNNIAPGGVTLANGVGGNAVPSVSDYNLCTSACPGANSVTGTALYSGGSNPTSRAGFALTALSPGKNDASDGTDMGANP